jgi:hypothetical protein
MPVRFCVSLCSLAVCACTRMCGNTTDSSAKMLSGYLNVKIIAINNQVSSQGESFSVVPQKRMMKLGILIYHARCCVCRAWCDSTLATRGRMHALEWHSIMTHITSLPLPISNRCDHRRQLLDFGTVTRCDMNETSSTSTVAPTGNFANTFRVRPTVDPGLAKQLESIESGNTTSPWKGTPKPKE